MSSDREMLQIYSSIARLFFLFTTALFVVNIDLSSSSASISYSWDWRATACLGCVLGTYIFSWLQKSWQNSTVDNGNPFKGKKGPGFLTQDAAANINRLIVDMVTYDAQSAASVSRFAYVQRKSECVFAKRAKMWGSADLDETISLEENVYRMVPTFYKFTLAFQQLGLDGFVFELPGERYGSDIKTFSKGVRSIMLTLREADIKRQRRQLVNGLEHRVLSPVDVENRLRYLGPEDTNKWGTSSWVMEFNKVTFFVTTIAPFYPETNSRFGHGASNCYVIFQPELSFAIYDLPSDTAVTNWEKPVTVRDKIRVAFRDAGREYTPPMVTRLPMVYDIVKPTDPTEDICEWWKDHPSPHT